MQRESTSKLVNIIKDSLPWQVASCLIRPEFLATWEKLVGSKFSKYARPICLEKNKRLIVAVRNNIWWQELTLFLPKILAAMRQYDLAINDIKLVLVPTIFAMPFKKNISFPLISVDDEIQVQRSLDFVHDPDLHESLLSLRRAQIQAEKLRN